MTAESQYYTIGALEKSFSVIERMTHRPEWELGELSKACGFPKGTLQRILLTLEALGYVGHEHRGGTYRLTLKFYKIGRSIVANCGMVEQARPLCRRLLQTVNETVNLCLASGMDMVVVDQQVSQHMLRLDSIIGSSFSIYGSASGKVFMAFLETSEAERFIRMFREERPGISTADIEALQKEFAVIREQGVGFDYEEIFAGVRCVAAPIFDYNGNITATISCSVPIVRITPEFSATLITEILQTATIISGILGAPSRLFKPPMGNMVTRGTD